jgi:putative DNA primase/helicase
MMSAGSIARALGGRKIGGGWIARCPSHEDNNPSLSIRSADDGKVLVHCHAGCDQAQVIAALRRHGLWVERGHYRSIRLEARRATRDVADCNDAKRKEAALRIWRATICAAGTLVETYLQSRGILIAVPAAIRFHPQLKHPSGSTWPAMVALVTRATDDVPLGIHRTYLSSDGTAKAAVEAQRLMLGPCRSGAVRLASASHPLLVGEGIETCLAANQATGHSAWAALSASGLRVLDLPGEIRDVIVLADGDDPGEAAAGCAAQRWKRERRRVRIAWSPRGLDFNDLLLGHALHVGEDA